MRIRSMHTRLSCLVALAAILAGCSQSPTAPVVNQQAAGATSATAERWSEPSPSDVPPAPVPAPGPTVVADPAAESSKLIFPLLGGTVSAGRFKLVIPPGALRQGATVTVRQPRLDVREVQLEISPASANGFLVPVLLVANCSEMSSALLSLQTIFWWNPTSSRWEAVLGVQVNLLGRTLTAPLWHFSTYKVDGKAGW